MPTARELLEQADALMRRNRSPAIDDIPVLTDSVSTITEALLAREEVHEQAVAARTLSDPIPTLTDRIESSAAVAADAVMVEGDPSDWLDFDQAQPSIIGEAPDSIAIVPPVELARDLDEALLESAEHEEIELTSPVEDDFDQELEARAAELPIAPAQAAPPTDIVLPGVVPSAAALAAAMEEAALAHPVPPVGEPPASPAEPAESAAAPPESAPTPALATPHAFPTPQAFVTPQTFATPRVFAPAPVSPVAEPEIVPMAEPVQAPEVEATPMPAATSELESFSTPEPELVSIPEPELVSIPEPELVSIPEPELVSIPEPELVSIPEPELVSIPEPELVSIPEPELVSIPEPELVSIPEPESVSIPEPELVSIPEPELVSIPEPELVSIPEPELVSIPEPELVSIPEPELVSIPEPELVSIPEPELFSTPEPVQVETAPATSGPWDDQARWDMAAEEIRMQVLQRIDLFTDTGLREQLGSRLKPIVDRASADLVATINQHVGELLRAYVAEAIEREIEQWRETNVPKS